MPDTVNAPVRKDFSDLVVYEVYVRSFRDADGDGVGDLDGVTEKLDYLQHLGVNAVWLTPCYKSPERDNGYDVADYLQIAEKYGGFSAFERLRDGLHARGMRLITDLVFNHTSSEHTWFLQARSARDNPYHDYYIWANEPLNDWQSVFGGSAWEYNEATDEYYLHSFAKEQPDLNWENPSVRKACKQIAEFWIKNGVDGFRCDVLDFIAKDFDKNKMHGGARLHEYLQELFSGEIRSDVFTVGECQTSLRDLPDLCGKNRGELTTAFQFDHFTLAGENKYLPRPFSLFDVKNLLAKQQVFAQEKDLLLTLFTDNHDQPFFLSKIGAKEELRYEAATLLAAMFFLLRGVPFLYQGQEYGRTNPRYADIAAFQDVEGLRYYAANSRFPEAALRALNRGSRDNARRPMAWNGDEKTAFGFTTGTPWLRAHSRAAEINAEADLRAEKSVLRFYRALLALRKRSLAVRRGDFRERTAEGQNAFVYTRRFGEEAILVVCNFEHSQEIVYPDDATQENYRLILSNYADAVPFSRLLRPYEVTVYEPKRPFPSFQGAKR